MAPPKVQPPGQQAPTQQAPKQASKTRPDQTEDKREEVKDAQSQEAGQTQAQAEGQTKAEAKASTDHAEVLSKVSESERSAPDEPLSEAELEGLALTAKLNEGMRQVYAEPEFKSRTGIFNEPNRVENVPPDSVVTWATPNWVDQGMHLNWLLTEGGHRMVHPLEVSKHRDGRGIHIPGRFEDKGDHVEQNGAILCIAKKSYTEAHRQATYQESVYRRQGAIENFQSQGDELDAKGTQIRRGSDKVDMGRYTPMRDA